MPELSNEALAFKVDMLTSRLADVAADVAHHEQDLYRGDHNLPSITTRIYNLERMSRAMEWIAAASIMTFITVVGWMASQLLKAWNH